MLAWAASHPLETDTDSHAMLLMPEKTYEQLCIQYNKSGLTNCYTCQPKKLPWATSLPFITDLNLPPILRMPVEDVSMSNLSSNHNRSGLTHYMLWMPVKDASIRSSDPIITNPDLLSGGCKQKTPLWAALHPILTDPDLHPMLRVQNCIGKQPPI
jgi:hypothetical protein